MPKKESIQQKLKRIRPPRVQITYDVEIGGAIEMKELPFVVGVNQFDGELAHDLDTVRWALAVDPSVPVIAFDARRFLSVRDAVLLILEEALVRARARQAARRSETGGDQVVEDHG